VKVPLTGLLRLISELSSGLILVASRFEIGSPESSTSGVGESEEDTSDGDKLQEGSNSSEAGVCALSLLNPLLLFSLAHTLELEVSGVSSRSGALALEQDEHDGTDDGNEVERQVHDVSDDGAGSELCEWLRDEFTKTANGITAATDLALPGHEFGLALGDKSAVKGVDQTVLNQECLGQGVEDGATLVQAKQSSIDGGQGAVEDGENGGLRKVTEEEDTGECGDAEGDGRKKLGCERLPKLALREEVEDALEICQLCQK
jgi:hypothetical protein